MMNVVMCGDRTVYEGMILALYTLLTHNKNVNIYILSMNISVEDNFGKVKNYTALGESEVTEMESIVNYLDSNSNIVFVDAVPYYLEYLSESINNGSGFTPYASLRLILDKALPYLNEVLYFDCDVAVRKDISGLYEDCKRNRDYSAFAVYATEAFGGEGEMISGIMFLHLDMIRKNGFFERARHNYMVKLYRYPDQMALRDSGPIGQLDESYGYFRDYRKYSVDPYILHFTCFLTPKIYDPNTELYYFFNLFPEFKYVQDGIRLIDTINGFN